MEKKEEREVWVREEISEIAFADLEKWINSRMDEELEAIKPQASQIRGKVQTVMNSIKSLGDELRKIEINPEKVAGQYMPMIKDAKKTLLIAIQKEASEQMPEIRSFDDVLAVRDRTKKLLSRLGDTSGSHRRVIHSFFSRHAKVLKLQLGLLNREASSLNRLIDGYAQKTSSLSDCIAGMSKISSALNESSTLAEKSAELKDELEALRTKEGELVGRIEDLRSSESFQQYKVYKEELARVRKDAEILLSEIGSAFSKISRPLSKYTYEVGLDKGSRNLIQSVMDDPLHLIRNPKVEELREILGKVREAVRTGKIVVKNPDKDVENIAALMKDAGQHVDAYRGYESKMQVLRKKTSPLEVDLERLRYMLERMRYEIAQKESFLDDSSRRLAQAGSAVSAELKRIEERVESTTGYRIKVRI